MAILWRVPGFDAVQKAGLLTVGTHLRPNLHFALQMNLVLLEHFFADRA